MSLLSGLGFSRLIKTVVPGLLIVGIIGGYVDLVTSFAGHGDPVFQWMQRNFSLAAALALLLGVVLGIFSNMVVFAWANDRLIRKRFDRERPEIGQFEQAFLKAVTQAKASRFSRDLAAAKITLDLEYLLTEEVDLGRWSFLQDSYWYYLEFGMNMSMATVLAVPWLSALSVKGFLKLSAPAWVAAVAAVVVVTLGTFIVLFLINTARLNYSKYRMKRLSLLVAAADAAMNSRGIPKANDPALERTLLGSLKHNRRRDLRQTDR